MTYEEAIKVEHRLLCWLDKHWSGKNNRIEARREIAMLKTTMELKAFTEGVALSHGGFSIFNVYGAFAAGMLVASILWGIKW